MEYVHSDSVLRLGKMHERSADMEKSSSGHWNCSKRLKMKMATRGIKLEEFKVRIIFMSIKSMNVSYAHRFPKGHWSIPQSRI